MQKGTDLVAFLLNKFCHDYAQFFSAIYNCCVLQSNGIKVLIILWCRTVKNQNAVVSVNDVKLVSLKLLSKFQSLSYIVCKFFSLDFGIGIIKAVQGAKQKNNKKCC